jgi:hypothetical protein
MVCRTIKINIQDMSYSKDGDTVLLVLGMNRDDTNGFKEMQLCISYCCHKYKNIEKSYPIAKIMGLQKFKHKNFYYSYSDDNTKVAFQYTCSVDQKSKICIWDILKKEKVYQIESTGQTAPIHFTTDGGG